MHPTPNTTLTLAAANMDLIKDLTEGKRDYIQGHIKPRTIIYIHESIIVVG